MSILKLPNALFIPRRSMGFINNRSKHLLEMIGNREMVGHGMNGKPMYNDDPNFPFPSLRYKETTPEIYALYEKQKGDWKMLTKEEKKRLYRSNFCQTFVEFQEPRGEYMEITGYVLIGLSLAVWMFMFMHWGLGRELPDSFLKSAQRAQLRRMIDLQVNPIEGLASEWDYERNDWKKKTWRTPPNPFVKCPDDNLD